MRPSAKSPVSGESLRTYSFLTAVCQEEHEAYFPTDGGAYLDRSYFRRAGLEEVRGFWKKTVRLVNQGRAPRELGLYIHWPFCVSRCSFCFCSMTVARGRGELRSYAQMLKREIDALWDVFKGVEFSSIYIGGGTPTTIPDDILKSLFRRIRERFTLAPEAEIYMEASPVTLTAEKMRTLRGAGVNHVTLGVQSLDDEVLTLARRRGQSAPGVEKAFAVLAGEKNMLSSVDLIYGLDGQTDRSFLDDFVRMTRMGPHNLRVYAFDPRPHTAFAEAGKRTAAGARRRQWNMMESLDALARRMGYVAAPLDPEDDEYLCAITRQCRMARKWGASVLGIGASALSHAFGAAWYGHPSICRASAVEAQGTAHRWEGIPSFYAMDSGISEEMRGFVVRHLYTLGRMSRRWFRELFGRDIMGVGALARPLRDLRACGKVRIENGEIVFLSKNRLERQVFGKHLFSPKLVRALLKGRRSAYREFSRAYSDEEVNGLRAVADKRVASLMRMYYRPAAKRPDWCSGAMDSEKVCLRNGRRSPR